MNEKEQKEYLQEYKKEKEKGVPFFPDILFKDAVVSLLLFVILVGLAYFLGAPLEERANPANTDYTPRPEWYFLFLFQLLKYFPGKLEVLGVVVLPSIVLLLLFILPLTDRSPKRHFLNRLQVTVPTTIIVAGIVVLTYLSFREAPPPSITEKGDPIASLYAENCSACHGASIEVKPGANLHNIIAEGNHDGMPAWSADLTSDEIDALAGFITSPGGSQLFNQNCGSCHVVEELVEGSPMDLKLALENGVSFQPHEAVQIPDWNAELSLENRTTLLNFLVAPDGQRLFATNCSTCHGSSLAFAGSDEELRQVISQGGKHLDMPGWKEQVTPEQLDQLSRYIFDPSGEPQSQALFQELCSSCHGQQVPQADSIESAREIIESGGPHRTMPVWGDFLTTEQLDALVSFTRQSTGGNSVAVGQTLFSQHCAACHGTLGEGGPNPTKAGDIIAPISSAEYLKTRDDITLMSIISQGQPNFGMSPFGTSNGGPLNEDDIETIVGFIRSWEIRPPVELPPEVVIPVINEKPIQLYAFVCAQCHGVAGEGGVGPEFQSVDFQNQQSDQEIFDSINIGHGSTAMIGWGDILSADQIAQLVALIRSFKQTATSAGSPDVVSFSRDVLPIFAARCASCHGSLGGWDGSNYATVMESGNNSPVIIAGDSQASLLVQKLFGIQTIGGNMPPGKPLTQEEIDLIVSWIAAGAADN